MSKRSAIVLFALLLLPVVAAVVVVGVLLYERDTGRGELIQEMRTRMGEPEGGRMRTRHILPAGYVGWATAGFGVPGAAPLRPVNGKLLLEYPDEGRLETSTDMPRLVRQEFYYKDGENLERLEVSWPGRPGTVWGLETRSTLREADDGTEEPVSAFVTFFVGTREQYESTPRPHRLDPLALVLPSPTEPPAPPER
jgi:hypothetical protein